MTLAKTPNKDIKNCQKRCETQDRIRTISNQNEIIRHQDKPTNPQTTKPTQFSYFGWNGADKSVAICE